MLIISFMKDYRFLSNFHMKEVKYKDIIFPSNENAYQAAKCKDESLMYKFKDVTPAYAREMGNRVELRDDWEEVKYSIMLDLNKQKYTEDLLFELIKKTKDYYLVEGNYWHDNYWGVCYCKQCKGIGQNNLGNIIMDVRSSGLILI